MNTEEVINRTPQASRDALEAALANYRATAGDGTTKELLSVEVLDEIFRLAWRHQFDDERGLIRKTIQEILVDRVSWLDDQGQLL